MVLAFILLSLSAAALTGVSMLIVGYGLLLALVGYSISGMLTLFLLMAVFARRHSNDPEDELNAQLDS